ncbi:alkaline phosphatase family protein [Actinoallomurus acanthiterrae]
MRKRLIAGTAAGLAAAALAAPTTAQAGPTARHVLLLSVDGLHESDLVRYAAAHPTSALAGLLRRGTSYPHARTTTPSDSFPGLLSMVTGGTPRSTGVYYDDSYDRSLSAPGSACTSKGTEVVYDESVDRDSTKVDGGGGLDPAKFPRDPAKNCAPVAPHAYLRVDTVFEVAKKAGLRTAWSDKHLAYDIVNGPSGTGVDDLYTPEIASVPASGTAGNDDLKVAGILHEVDGYDHTGTHRADVPAIFGMNFQAVSVAQKDPAGGYQAGGAPGAELTAALDHTDASIGRIVAELGRRNLLGSTDVIVTAKHGQSPIDRSKLKIIGTDVVPGIVNAVKPGLVAQATQDDVGLIWLTDQSKTAAAAAALREHAASAGIARVLAGEDVVRRFGDPRRDPRVPDLVVITKPGVIYTKPGKKIAEHGGFSADDTHVALVAAGPGFRHTTIGGHVRTTQIAPSILTLLGLRPDALQAVRIEGTRPLPR